MNALNYYQYSTPQIIVKWNGHTQPGRYKTAQDAINAVKKMDPVKVNWHRYEIICPNLIDGCDVLKINDY